MKLLTRLHWPQRDALDIDSFRPAMQIGVGGAVGAGLMYLFDAYTGRRRRAMLGDRSLATVRRAGRRAERFGRLAGVTANGMVQRVLHAPGDHQPAPNDAALADRIRSEVFRGPNHPAAHINVSVEDGVAVLRGQLAQPEQIRDLEAAVGRVDGVRDVQSYLHLPNTPAPNKLDALRM